MVDFCAACGDFHQQAQGLDYKSKPTTLDEMPWAQVSEDAIKGQDQDHTGPGLQTCTAGVQGGRKGHHHVGY
jgi:hypothetical protein